MEQDVQEVLVGVCSTCGCNEYLCHVCDFVYCDGEGHKC